jgi:hypothetical protein
VNASRTPITPAGLIGREEGTALTLIVRLPADLVDTGTIHCVAARTTARFCAATERASVLQQEAASIYLA